MLDGGGRVIYVGKAKRLRARLLSYFRARHPEKAARILSAASDIRWDYVPSEFAALLGELRLIRRHRPSFNVRMNRVRRAAFIKVSGSTPSGDRMHHYGPFIGAGQLDESIRFLNDLLGLRDCALKMPIVFAEQGDLFREQQRAACLRYELGTCSGPCGGLVTEAEYLRRVDVAVAFIEGRSVEPLDHVIANMLKASEGRDFERATWWRERFDSLTWLLGVCGQVQSTLENLSFVYTDPGTFGDDRSYVIRRALVRASAPAPRTPIEVEAFRALVAEQVGVESNPGPIPCSAIDETLLVLRWFRRRPAALRRTVSLPDWLEQHPSHAGAGS